jgi:hypothetical protein
MFSEYAYFYSENNSNEDNESDTDKGFWAGLSKKLGIKHKESVANTFREVTGQGIERLGLVQTKNGYKYISNLWIQNGIPVKNFPHFSELLQNVVEDYSWWEIAQSDTGDITALLLQYWQEKYSERRTLGHFLKISFAGETDTESVAGMLVQGISRVADALESNNMPIHILQYPNAAVKLLKDYELPKSFFLRDWNQLIEILTPRKGSHNQIVSHKRKSLFFFLDLVDTGQTQLILPEQKIWKPDWENFRGSPCSIKSWDGQIPHRGKLEVPDQGKLEVPELVIKVDKTEPIYSSELINNKRQIIYNWKTRGIEHSLPCLIFDALRGTHLPVYLPKPQIIGIEEIICFYPKEITIEFSEEIETIDPYIPCSIHNWRGQQIRLLDHSASIDFIFPDDRPSQKIIWNRDSESHPALVGTRLMNLKGIDIYLDPPTFWYPPSDRDFTINMILDNLNERTTITRQTYPKQKSSEWYQIPLQEWITKTERYQVYFEIDYQRWTYQFEFRREYRIPETPAIVSPSIELQTGESIPYICNSSNQFWSKTITIKGLWVLEEIVFLLDNGKESIAYQVQADTSGDIIFNVSVLYDALSRSDDYRLKYQRLGLETRELLEYRA